MSANITVTSLRSLSNMGAGFCSVQPIAAASPRMARWALRATRAYWPPLLITASILNFFPMTHRQTWDRRLEADECVFGI